MPNKVAVVTGGNKGIGFAIVKGLCQNLKDYDILLTARDETRGKEAVDKMQQDFGVTAKFFPLDITNKATIERLKSHLEDTYGGLDVLVNNAGIMLAGNTSMSYAEIAQVTMNTNFTGTADVCDALFPLLRKGARVVHISAKMSTGSTLKSCSKEKREKFASMKTLEEVRAEMAAFVEAAKQGNVEEQGYATGAYGMSKIGVTSMTPVQQKILDARNEDILVNACCPGYTDTDMTSGKGAKTVDQAADTPIYLATLPTGTTSPKGDFVTERAIIPWQDMVANDQL